VSDEEASGSAAIGDADEGGAAGQEGFSPGRLEGFSDAVMAVIITIMALELKAPAGDSLHDLRQRLPELLIYVLSFTYVGIYWNNHHHLLRVTPRINGAVMWANLAVLFWLSLVPTLTQWVAVEYRHSLPAAAYGAADLGAAVAYYVLVHEIVRANAGSKVADAIGSDFKGIVSAVMYGVAIGFAFITPWLAYAIYVLVALFWLVPDRRLTRGRSVKRR
jgi:uncharacterized membrane protein